MLACNRKAEGEEGSPAKRSRKAVAKADAKEGKPDMSEAALPPAAAGAVPLLFLKLCCSASSSLMLAPCCVRWSTDSVCWIQQPLNHELLHAGDALLKSEPSEQEAGGAPEHAAQAAATDLAEAKMVRLPHSLPLDYIVANLYILGLLRTAQIQTWHDSIPWTASNLAVSLHVVCASSAKRPEGMSAFAKPPWRH